MAEGILIEVRALPKEWDQAGETSGKQFSRGFNSATDNKSVGGLSGALSQAVERSRELAQKFRQNLEAIGETATRVGKSLSLSLSAPLAIFGVTATQTAVHLDSLKRGLIAVSGSSDAAEKQLVSLREVAKLPGLGFEEAISGSIRLQAAGLSAAEAERSLKGFGNALATVGKGKADLDGVTLALSQIQAKGKVSAEEINQIAERVPQIRQVLLDAFGTADTELLQKAGITSQEFIHTVNTALEKLPLVTGGAQNALENFDDVRKKVFGQFGDAILRILVPLLERVTPLLERVGDAFAHMSPTAQTAAVVIGGIAAAIGPVLIAFGSLAGSIGAIIGLFGGTGAAAAAGGTVATVAGGGLLATFGTVIAVLAAVGLAAFGLYKAWQTNFLGIRDITANVISAVKEFFGGGWRDALKAADESASNLVATLEGYWNAIPVDVRNALSGIGSFFSDLFTSLLNGAIAAGKSIGSALVDGLNFAFDGLGDRIINKAKGAYESLKNFFSTTPIPQPTTPSGVGTTFLNGPNLNNPATAFAVSGNSTTFLGTPGLTSNAPFAVGAEQIGQIVARSFVEEVQQSAGFQKWAEAIKRAGGDVFLKEVESVAKAVGADPRDLLGVFAFESSLDPSKKNPGKGNTATGLIQFTEKTAESLGTSTETLRTLSAIDQLTFVQQYLEQFGKTLDSTEKLYTAVLRGKVISDPNKVLFTDVGATTNKDPFFANRGLDKDHSGTVTVSEAAAQVTRQGFSQTAGQQNVIRQAAADAQLFQTTLKDTVGVVSDVKAGIDPIAVSAHQLAASVEPIPVNLSEAARAALLFGPPVDQATAATNKLGDSASKAAEQAATLAKTLERVGRQEIIDSNKKLRTELENVGKNLDLKAEGAQLQAILAIRKADEDAVLEQIKLRTELADKTIFHSDRSSAAVLAHLNQETKSVTDLVTQSKITLIDKVFSAADSGIAKLTAHLGIFKDFVQQILSGLARMVLSKAFQAIFGGGSGGSGAGFSLAGAGGGGGGLNLGNLAQSLLGGRSGSNANFLTPPFNPSANSASGVNVASLVQQVTSGNLSSSISTPPSISSGLPNLPTNLPGVNLNGIDLLTGLPKKANLLSSLGGLFQGFGFGKAPGSALGGLAAAAPLLGLSIGAGLGGSSILGQLLGGAGGLALGVGLTAAPTALAGTFLAPLFSNPITAIVGGVALIGAILLGRAKQRHADEATSGDALQQAVDQIHDLTSQVKADQVQLNVQQAHDLLEKQIIAPFIAAINQLKTRSVRESRLAHQVPDLRNLFEKEVIPEIQAQQLRIKAGTIGGRNIVPEFANSGVVPGVYRGFDDVHVMAHAGEMFLNRQHQAMIAALAGGDIFRKVGVPDAPVFSAQGVQTFANSGTVIQSLITPSGGSAPDEFTVIITPPGITEDYAVTILKKGTSGPAGRSVILKAASTAAKRRE